MLWYVAAVIAALGDGAKNLLHRAVLKTENPYAYALIENAGVALLFIPLVVVNFTLPREPQAWLLLGLASVLWAAIVLLGHFATKFTPVTIKTPLSQLRVLFVFLLSAFFLSEAVTSVKLFGTVFVFAGTALLTYRQQNAFGRLSDRGVQLTILSALLAAVVAIVDKAALNYFDAAVYGFFVYLVPTAILLFAVLSVKQRVRDTKKLWLRKWKLVVPMLLTAALAYYATLLAYKGADASLVFPIIRSSTIVTVIAGSFFFHEERKEIIPRLLASIVIVGGVLLLSGYFT